MNVKFRITGRGLVFLFSLIAVFMVSSCEKHVTPSKVERKLTVDGWQITNFLSQDTIVTGEFSNMIFGFGEEGDIIVIGQTGITGAWTIGENKDPTVLYITGFTDSPFIKLNDDWTVLTVNSSRITMESDNGAYLNKLAMEKVEY